MNPMLMYPFLIENVFTPEECKQIIATGLSYAPLLEGKLLKKEPGVPQGTRRALQKPQDYQPLIDKIMPAAAQANHSHYKFQISGVEVPHFCEYKVGESSPWHHDFASEANTNRKLTLLVFLSDPTEFEGGQFHVHPFTERKFQQQGNLLIFPAYLMHQVEPVLSGVRYSLITWGIGAPFV